MTRKDYELIAKSIRLIVDEYDKQYRDNRDSALFDSLIDFRTVANSIAIDLAKDNPRFDKDRFLNACGVEFDPLAYLIRAESIFA